MRGNMRNLSRRIRIIFIVAMILALSQSVVFADTFESVSYTHLFSCSSSERASADWYFSDNVSVRE